MLRRWNSAELTLFLSRVCRVFVVKHTKKTFTTRWKGKIWVKLKIYFHCASPTETSKITQIRHSTKSPLDSCLSVLVKFYNICGYKILTGLFPRCKQIKIILEEKRSEAYSGPNERSRMNYFCKNKNNLNQSFVITFHVRCLRGSLKAHSKVWYDFWHLKVL